MTQVRLSLALALLCACASPSATPKGEPSPPVTTVTTATAPTTTATVEPSPVATDEPAPPIAAPAINVAAARALLFPTELAEATPACEASDARDQIRCLLGARYAKDAAAREDALALFERTGAVAGLDREQDMDGGYRGQLHLVPELPVGPRRKHLAWTRAALDDIDDFFTDLGKRAPEKIRYRHRALALRFFRSVRARTPSAYAQDWSVAYNVDGSLFVTADAARETFFHEVFHLNDQERGGWSPKALGAIFDAIVAKCGTSIPCLRPYAPSETTVRNGTYYAFQPGNGVGEYAAELALRYYREERLALAGKKLPRAAFKCGPDENRRAWALLRDEFFGKGDAVPDCASR